MQFIAIHSVPRSGSTWLGNIFNSHPQVSFKYQPLFSYAFKGYLSEKSSRDEITKFFTRIMKSDDGFINQSEAFERGLIPEFNKTEITHICYKEVRYHYILENMIEQIPDCKVILLIRNPLSVIYSWLNAPKEFRPDLGWIAEEEWLNAPKKNQNKPEEYNGYMKWKEVANMFLDLKSKYANNVQIVEYSMLIKNPKLLVRKLFDFTNLDFNSNTEEFIDLSTTRNEEDAYSVFKNKSEDDNWKLLPKEITEYVITDLKGTNLEQFLNE